MDLNLCRNIGTSIFSNGEGCFNNGHIVISKDMIFGLSVWDGQTFYPLDKLDLDDFNIVLEEINKGQQFLWGEELEVISKKIKSSS